MPDASIFDKLLAEAEQELTGATSEASLAALQTKYLGRKGRLTLELRRLGTLPPVSRRAAGRAGNQAKRELEELIKETQKKLGTGRLAETFDITAPGASISHGHLHPITLTVREIVDIFMSMGFSVAEGPEVETDWYNFEALNLGPDHPGRDAWDTFYIAGSENKAGRFTLLPRTHTSPVQIRVMEQQKPPLRVVVPGKVYRNEAEDATHGAIFCNIEGLMVDETVTFSDLKGILTILVKRLLGEDARLRFRPSHFPFTEPSAEVDVSSPRVRGGEWLELLGAGMVHPQVLRNGGIDPKRYQGFAFGIGAERFAMLKYGIEDLRLFYKPDVRLLEQF